MSTVGKAVRNSLWVACWVALAVARPLQAQVHVQAHDPILRAALDEAGAKARVPRTIDSNLRLLYHEYSAASKDGRSTAFESQYTPAFVVDGHVVIDASGTDGAALLADLEALGLQRGTRYGRSVSGHLPVDRIPSLGSVPSLRTAHVAAGAPSIGATTNQADFVMQTDERRAEFGIDGSGYKGCVLSDSYDTAGSASTDAAQDVSTGDLPGAGNPNGFTTPVNVVQEGPSGASDEGRAMLQIIHDVAPGAELGFHTSLGGNTVMAQGYTDLLNAGCDLIVDNWIYFTEPFFQDGIIAQAASAAGSSVPVFSSAGNDARQSYHAAFVNSDSTFSYGDRTDVPGHAFDGTTDARQQITIPSSTSLTLVLQWDDPYYSASSPPGGAEPPGADTDLDILLLDEVGALVAASFTDNVGGNPVELLRYRNRSSQRDTLDLVITKVEGPDPERLQYIYFGADSGITIEEYATNSPTLFGRANADNVEAVGAAVYLNTPEYGQDPPLLNTFSSVGGIPIYYDASGNRLVTPDVRQKPGIVGPDGGNTTFFGSDGDGDGFPNFLGTSAAAPACGAMALLFQELNPSAPATDAISEMRANAVDMDNPYTAGFDTGFDFATGFGLCVGTRAFLPVELTAFDVQADGDVAVLRWATATETNNSGFEVEHQRGDGTDAPDAGWQTLGFVEGAGTTTEAHAYRFVTAPLEPGLHRFRLRQVDFDGSFEYSPEVEVRVAVQGAFRVGPAYPNPFERDAYIRLAVQRAQHVRVEVFDATGRSVAVLLDEHVPAQQVRTVEVEGNGLPSGLYYVRTAGETFATTQPVVRVR